MFVPRSWSELTAKKNANARIARNKASDTAHLQLFSLKTAQKQLVKPLLPRKTFHSSRNHHKNKYLRDKNKLSQSGILVSCI
jgi:hypothetical protein